MIPCGFISAMHSGNHPSRVAMLENTDRGNHSQMSAEEEEGQQQQFLAA